MSNQTSVPIIEALADDEEMDWLEWEIEHSSADMDRIMPVYR